MASYRFTVRMVGGLEERKAIAPKNAGERLSQLINEGWDEIRVGGTWHDLLDEGAAAHAQKLIEVGARTGPR